MRRIFKIGLMAFSMALAMPVCSYAGEWHLDNAGWWYDYGEGKYPAGQWFQVGDDWYYANADGYTALNTWVGNYYVGTSGAMLKNTTTPDGYKVGADGAWISETTGNTQSSANSTNNSVSLANDTNWYMTDSTLNDMQRAAYHYYEYYMEPRYTYDYTNINTQMEIIYNTPNDVTARTQMTTIEIPIWRLSSGQKVAGTTTVTVLSSIADEVREIFTEIFNGPEQFPISSVGGYQWRQNGLNSNHSSGIALDINPEANPQIDEDGVTVLVGSKWEPGTNPYSISADGDVVKVFGKHGWTWGAGYRRSDLMHFDFPY